MLEGTRVQDVMTKEFVSVHPETSLKEVTRLVSSKGYEAYPVVDKEGLAGIVDVRDVMQVQPNKIESTSVKDVMSPAHTIRPEQSLPEAISKMNKQNVDRLVVIDEANRKPIGLVTHQCVLGGYEGARKRRSHAKQKYGKK
jgi:predicted transcriptional regulator